MTRPFVFSFIIDHDNTERHSQAMSTRERTRSAVAATAAKAPSTKPQPKAKPATKGRPPRKVPAPPQISTKTEEDDADEVEKENEKEKEKDKVTSVKRKNVKPQSQAPLVKLKETRASAKIYCLCKQLDDGTPMVHCAECSDW